MASKRGPGGAIAGGSPMTVEAGLHAFALGGNAVDAWVAAQLMACVAEPLLTGLGGGGLVTWRVGGESGVCDFFSDFPGRGRSSPPTGRRVEVIIDYGPTTQLFSAGPAAVAAPGMPAGLWAMHQRFGRVPMERLVEPAARAAREGTEVMSTQHVAGSMLWGILSLTPESAGFLGRSGRALREGEIFRSPALAETLSSFAHHGPDWFYRGEAARAILSTLGDEAWLTAADLAEYRPIWRPALAISRAGTIVTVPGPPSQGGALVLRSLLELWGKGPLPPPLGAEHVLALAGAMDAAERARPYPWVEHVFSEDFVSRYLGAGHTTHISAVDGEGGAVSCTTSLGETAGIMVPQMGLLLNNFLGEADVNPPDHPRPAGARLMTMCCPTLVEIPERGIYALGSGGSSRIRSSVLHGVVYMAENGLTPRQTVAAPRAHMEAGQLRMETFEREASDMARLRAALPDLVTFEQPGMYFGGLHIAGLGPDGFLGAGDPRRDGCYGCLSF